MDVALAVAGITKGLELKMAIVLRMECACN